MRQWLSGPKRNSVIVLVVGGLFVVACLIWGLSVFDRLKQGGFVDDKSSSAKAEAILEANFPKQQVSAVVILTKNGAAVSDPAFAAAIAARVEAIKATPGVIAAQSKLDSPLFVAKDSRSTYVTVAFDPKASSGKALKALEASQQRDDGVTAKFGGVVKINDEVSHQVQEDISRAELISFPILLILLLIIFRSVVAAILPLALGGIAILGAFLVLKGLSYVTDISVFAINIITLLGLGLAIDYSLFITSRFREELASGKSTEQALDRTMATAGRAVFFSGFTVAISMLSLLVFPQTFFRSMGLGGAAALMIAVLAALTMLPAALRLLGHNINALSLRRVQPHRVRADAGFWYRFARLVMRWPLVTGGVALELLVIAGLPFYHIAFTNVSIDALPKSFESVQVDTALKRDFVVAQHSAVSVVVSGGDTQGLTTYVNELAALPGAISALPAAAPASSGPHLVKVYYAGPTLSTDAQTLVTAIRAVAPPPGSSVETGGVAAGLVDQLASQRANLPLALGLIALTTSILLLVMTGSMVLPIKAIILNILSLSATFGIIVWIFQDNHLASVFSFTSTAAVDATMPILVFAIAFGLAMDYEVFLLSRVKEHYDETHNHEESIRYGLQHTGAIITSAAILLVVVIGAFSLSQIAVIKEIGVGLAVAVLLDATIVRMVLVPASMKVIGPASWWAPRWLQRLVGRFELE